MDVAEVMLEVMVGSCVGGRMLGRDVSGLAHPSLMQRCVSPLWQQFCT